MSQPLDDHVTESVENEAQDAVTAGTRATEVQQSKAKIPYRFLAGRAAFYLFTFWAAITLNFFLPRMMKGDAVSAYLARNRSVTPEAAQALRALLGLDSNKSVWEQYLDYLQLLVKGDLGVAITHGLRPVSEVIGNALPWTVGLVGLATVMAFTIGTIIGALIGWRRGSKLDFLIPVTTFLNTLPYFWLGLVAITIFSVHLGWLPIGKAYGLGMKPGFNWPFISDVLIHAILPVSTVVLASLGGWMLGMRNMMLTVLDEDYITVAQAKGLPERRILWKYAARNAVLPQIQSFALSLGFIVAGTVVMEQVFSYPGIGKMMLDAVNQKDYALMQGGFLVLTISVLLANVMADIAYAFLDPRTKQAQ